MNFIKQLFSKEKSYDKYGDVLKKKVTTKEQRWEAIQALEKLPAEKSVPQLLKRFEIVQDSGLQDTQEKEHCLKIICAFGEEAKPFIQEYLKTKRRVAWVLKIAEKIFSPQEYLSLLLQNLNMDMTFFDEDVLERNEEMLLALKEVQDETIVQAVSPFLNCRYDGLRVAALECLEAQAFQSEKAKTILLALLNAPEEKNTRFLGLVRSIAKKHGWIEDQPSPPVPE